MIQGSAVMIGPLSVGRLVKLLQLQRTSLPEVTDHRVLGMRLAHREIKSRTQ
jgi:hypothetical protein